MKKNYQARIVIMASIVLACFANISLAAGIGDINDSLKNGKVQIKPADPAPEKQGFVSKLKRIMFTDENVKNDLAMWIEACKKEKDFKRRDQMLIKGLRYANSTDDILKLANLTAWDTKARILRVGVSRASNASELVKLINASYYEYGRHDLVMTALKKIKNVDELLMISNTALKPGETFSHKKDYIILDGLKLAKNDADLIKLADNCYSLECRQKVLKNAKSLSEEQKKEIPGQRQAKDEMIKAYIDYHRGKDKSEAEKQELLNELKAKRVQYYNTMTRYYVRGVNRVLENDPFYSN